MINFVIPILAIIAIREIYKADLRSLKAKEQGPHPLNPSFDPDLDKLAGNNWETPEEIAIPENMKEEARRMLKNEHLRNRNHSLEDYFWEIGIINPDETIWVEGTPLEPFNEKDMQEFLQIKNQAMLKQVFHGKPLDDGGLDDLYIAWFRLKGCSLDGANFLLTEGQKPWEFKFD